MAELPFRARIVEVLQDIGTATRPNWSIGSGYRIGAGFILTASHVVTAGPVIVRMLGPAEDDPKIERTAVRILHGPPESIDIAVLRLTDGAEADFPWAEFARIDRNSPTAGHLRRCQAVGFPLYRDRALAAHDTERISGHVEGDIALGDDLRTGLLTLQMTRPLPPPERTGRGRESPYLGMSGSAVTVGASVLGVVGRHLGAEGNALEVTPITHLRRLGAAERERWAETLNLDLDALRVAKEPPPEDADPIRPLPRRVVAAPPATILVLPRLSAIAQDVDAFLRDVRETCDRYLIKPEAVVVPGGAAPTAARSEYATAHEILSALGDRLDIPAASMLVVPGAADVNANACREYFRETAEAGRVPEPPYWPKWAPFLAHLDRYCPGFAPDRPWSWLADDEHRLVIAGLNSTVYETGDTHGRRGRLGDEQVAWFETKLADHRAKGWTCVGVLYDSPVTDDYAPSLADSTSFTHRLAPHLDIVVHGRGRAYQSRVVGAAGMQVIAPSDSTAGTYELIRASGSGRRVWGRAYDPLRGGWGVDPGIGTDARKGWRRF